MIILLGSHGYIGSAFAQEMTARGIDWMPASYLNLEKVSKWISGQDMVINCSAFIPKESVSLCDTQPEATLNGNLLLPIRLSRMCEQSGATLAHLSTGYLWNDGKEHGEDDPPQRMFRGYCGFYIGTKVLADREVQRCPKHYIWRLSLAFDECDNDRNYLSKLAGFYEIFDRDNCVSHRFDFVRSCLQLWKTQAPFGAYNVMNEGSIKATHIVDLLKQAGIRRTDPRIISGGHGDSKASISKLLSAGISMRSSEDAVLHSIKNWIPRK